MPRPLCKDDSLDPEIWFPMPHDHPTAELAKMICATCPLQRGCLAWALAKGIDHGIWGGKDAHERRILRRHGMTIGDPNANHPIRNREVARQAS